MDAAKSAISEFMAKSGHHDTTVHEKVAPAVVHETINRERREHIQTAIDKEIHQDHYHTSIQPVKDREVLPEQHHHNLGAVEHRTFDHGNEREVADRLKTEAAQFHDKRIEGTERHTQSVAPTLAGEHIHHHVHETIQPIVQKETIEAHVVHTVVPIHEVHHNAAQHHTASALPAVSMADFKKQGGVLTGREERYDGFEGEPRSVGGHSHGGLKGAVAGAGVGATGAGIASHRRRSGSSSSSSSSDDGTGRARTHRTHRTKGAALGGATGAGLGHSTTGHSTTGTGLGHSTTGHSTTGTGLGHSTTGHSTTGSGLEHPTTTGYPTSSTHNDRNIDSKTGKPSLMDKLNPMTDSNHDGKKGFMK